MKRQKTVFDNAELPHIWAKQSQEEGRTPNGSMSFNGECIYSYSTIMGQITKDEQGRHIVLLNDRTYSTTTSQHQSKINHATSHMTRIFIDGVRRGDTFFRHAPELVAEETARFHDVVTELGQLKANPRKKIAPYFVTLNGKVAWLEIMASHWPSAVQGGLLNLFRKVVSDLEREFKGRLEKEKHQEQARKHRCAVRDAAKQAIREEEQRNRAGLAEGRLELWKDGNLQVNTLDFQFLPCSLRLDPVDNNTVQTSWGATVKRQSVERLYSHIKEKLDLRGYSIDGYTVIGVVKDALQVGCHRIELAEVQRFAAVLGL